MQDSEFFFLLERIGRERGLSLDALLESIKETLASAYKKKYNEPATRGLGNRCSILLSYRRVLSYRSTIRLRP